MPGSTRTATGLLPEDWSLASLAEVSDCLDNLRIPLNESQRRGMQGDIPYCGANGVLGYVNDYVVDDDIILIAEDGGYFDEYSIRPIAYRMVGKCWVNNHAHILKAKTGIDQAFLFQSLVHKNVLPFLASGTRAKLNKSEMEKIVVPLPPSAGEQRAIAAALSDTDALIESLEQLLAKKRQIKQGAMQELLTGKTRLPGFSGEWVVRSLGELCEKIQDGTHFSPAAGGTDFLYVTSKNIGRGSFDVSTAARISAVEHAKIYGRCDVRKGDLLLTKDGANTGNAAINPLEEPFSLLSSVALLRFDARSHATRFFLYQILSEFGQCQVLELMSGNAITRLTLGKIRSLRFPVPPIEEQTAIATVLSDMDAEIDALEAQLEKTRMIKQGMMHELLTGRIRLV